MQPIFVEEDTVVEAWRLIYLYTDLRKIKAKRKHVAKRPPRDLKMLGVAEKVSDAIEAWYVKHGAPVKQEIRRLVREAAKRHLYIRYALSLPGFSELAVIAFLASPPDITLKTAGPILEPSSYIATHFMPVRMRDGRVYRSVLARYFFSTIEPLRRFMSRFVSRSRQLLRIYERSLSRYTSKGYNPGRAKRLATRDVVRVMIGCVWLVRMHELLSKRLVKPSDVTLPYPEMLRDIEAGSGVEPYMIAEYPVANEVADYTWARLINAVKTGVYA